LLSGNFRSACRTNLGLPDSSRRLDIDDDRRRLQVELSA
jgi:hypothetical protein